MADKITGIQDGIHSLSSNADDFCKYSLFLGGTNARNDVLRHYTPLQTGYARIFMVRKPLFMQWTMESKFKRFKHILEYAFTAVSGLSDISMDTRQIAGSYGGKSIEVPTMVTDSTNAFTITVFEFSGSPVREVLTAWINGIHDLNSNLTHYNGYAKIDGLNDSAGDRIEVNQANETAEFIYVVTDRTGMNIEYACLLTNCFPKNINIDPFNFQSQSHDTVETGIEFACTKYESNQINQVAKKLVQQNMVLTNSLNFHSGFNAYDASPVTGDAIVGRSNVNTTWKNKYVNLEKGTIEDRTDNNDKALADKLLMPQSADYWARAGR